MASLGPELIVEIGGFPITNTLITTFLVDAVIVALVYATYRKISTVPAGLQSIFEPAIDYLYDLTESIAGLKAKTIFPWFASFFFFIVIANLIALLPGFNSIGFWEVAKHGAEHGAEHGEGAKEATKHLLPLFRAVTSDFNATLALGTISVVATHIISIKFNGLFGYSKKFLSKNPINLAIGLLEFLLEGVKIFSLSFRLFGNIFAGEVVLVTVAGLAAYSAFLAPIPFLLLEVIVALVQALVFAMLTMVFMSLLATTSSEGGGH
jgi:F-type H+-transporting ATPase subunit a